MPNLGGPELIILLLLLAIPAGIGYWCMTIWRRKGRSPGGGFAFGFFVTLFLSVIGAVIALVISYVMAERIQPTAVASPWQPAPPAPPVAPPPPPSEPSV